LFQLAGWILQALPAEPDRELLSARLSAKITGARRGRLYLPSYFPAEVRALSNMTTSQLRNSVYWFKASDGARYRLKKSTVNFIHQIKIDGYIRTGYGSSSVHKRQSELSKILPESDWPRLGTRAAWPSSPTFVEMLAMSRRGHTPLPVNRGSCRASRPITLAHFNSSAEVRAQIVSRQIVGIRSDVKVPEKYLGHFRYRWGFLILTGAYRMPIGLVRFLTGQWIRNLHNLWLREKTPFKKFLKSTEITSLRRVSPGPW